MAKSYTFTPQASFTLQDNLSQKLIDFSDNFTFNSITPDNVQFGNLEFTTETTVNLNPNSAGRFHIYVKNESESSIQVGIKLGTTDITSLFPGEFIYTSFRSTLDFKVYPVTAGNPLCAIKYFLIDG